MVPMTFIWWIYHFWAQFWPYFNFVDFRAYFGPFSLVNRDRQKMADLLRKMASNQKMQENKPTLKFNFTIEKRWPVSKFSFWHSHWALMYIITSIPTNDIRYGGWKENYSQVQHWPKIGLRELHTSPWELHKIFWNLFGLNAIFDIRREYNHKRNCSRSILLVFITNEFAVQ